MPYTLMKGLVWVLLAVLLGIVIGWLLRSVAARRQVERARSGNIDNTELERLRSRVANLEPVVNERDRLKTELDQASSAAPAAEVVAAPTAGTDDETSAEPIGTDVASATAVLGKQIALDDLTVIEGIGPTIAELCHGIGIRTWTELSITEVSLLRTMLADAGQRFKALDPSTWPEQAALLAAGSWAEFSTLTEGLDGGRDVD